MWGESVDKSKLFSAAEKAISKGQTDKAIDALEQVLSIDSDDVKALNKAADLHLKQGRSEMAVEFLSRVGEVYNRDGFYSKAIAIYKRILKINDTAPKSDVINIHEQLASLYGQLGLVSDAMNHFRIAVDYFDQTNDRERLLVALRKVSDLDPSNVDSQLKLAELFVAEEKASEAEFTLERLIELLHEKQKTPELIESYEKWVELFPKSIEPLKNLIRTYINGGEPKKALGKLQKAFRNDPYNAEILELLSATFREMKQPEKAKAVDVELIKIYRKSDEEDKLSVVESRVSNRPLDGPGSSSEIEAASAAKTKTNDTIDPADALIENAKLDPDERKVISECEVYLKYGLAEKAREVLASNLSKFSKSLALRWKLKTVQAELQESQDVAHSLSEIIMLAKSANANDWLQVASDELREIDSSHPALEEVPVDLSTEAVELPEAEIDTSNVEDESIDLSIESEEIEDEDQFGDNFDESDISIVVEDDIVSGPQDDLAVLQARAEETQKSKSPAHSADTKEQRIPENLQQQESMELLDLEDDDTMQEGAMGAEMLLSEEDFSDDELAQLDSSLDPEAKAKADTEPAQEIELESNQIEESSGQEVLELSADEPMELSLDDEVIVEPEVSAEGDSVEIAQDEDFEVQQALEEVAFFKSQGLVKEADKVLARLKKKYPKRTDWTLPSPDEMASPVVAEAKVEKGKASEVELEALGTKMKLTVQEDEGSEEADDYFDLAAELAMDDLGEEEEAPTSVPSEVKDVFAAFKKGVSESVSEEDYQTHYDLGVAYREMELYDDAIQSFQLCAKVEGKKSSSFYQVGLCEAQRGNFEAAKKAFDEALMEPTLVNQEKISISYELAESLVKLNDRERAKEIFEEIKSLDPEFRDVEDRLVELTN